jgi:pimeloyl-ACP methyl ester carboxylesterase
MANNSDLRGELRENDFQQVGAHQWFYRQAAPLGPTDRPPVLLLHGLVSQSYGWRKTLPALADQGYRAIAPDWLGCGYSDKPEQRDFPYSSAALIQGLLEFVDGLGLERFSLVTQGYLGAVGLQFALAHADRVERLAIFNAPIAATDKFPWKIRQLGLPLLGEALVQNFLLADQLLEGGGGYRIEDDDMDIYRRPWIKSSDGGRALHRTVQNLKLAAIGAQINAGLRTWDKPLLLAWGNRDPWLPIKAAQATAKSFPKAEFVELAEVGHYPQEDWPEKVNDALILFLGRQADR